MIYTVIWKREAERRLATIWLGSTDRPAITQAANQIDQQLRRDPDDQGESRPDGRRILLVPPLGVLFKVQPLDRVVTVVAVWQF
jgi:hypothetical protein